MRGIASGMVCVLLVLCSGLPLSAQQPVRVFRAGAAEVDITPSFLFDSPSCLLLTVGAPMGGYPRLPPLAFGVHDPICATAIVMDDGEDRIAVVSVDMVYPGASMRDDVCREIAQSAGITEDNLMLCATHDHSSVEPDFNLPGVKMEIVERISAAVVEASEELRPARLGVGTGHEGGLTMNRRHPGAGPIDPELGVIRIDEADGDPIAVMVNFDAHATVIRQNNFLLSAEYPGCMRQAVREKLGDDVVVLFSNGAEGDVETTALRRAYDSDFTARRQYEAAREVGERLAGDVLDVWSGIETASFAEVEVSVERVRLPRPRISRYVTWALLTRQGVEVSEQHIPALPFDIPLPSVTSRVVPMLKSEAMVQAIRLGDAVIVALPGEPFVKTGLSIKEGSKALGFGSAFVVGVANDYIMYVPTEEEYNKGGYEPGMCFYGPRLSSLIEEGALRAVASVSGSAG